MASLACAACYNLVQDRVNDHRDKLQKLEDLINNVGINPEIVNDEEFEKRLAELDEELDVTITEAEKAAGRNWEMITFSEDPNNVNYQCSANHLKMILR